MKSKKLIVGLIFLFLLGFQVLAADNNSPSDSYLAQSIDMLDLGQVDDYINREVEFILGPNQTKQWILGILKGDVDFDLRKLLKSLWELITTELTQAFRDGKTILTITILFAFFSLLGQQEDEQTTKVAQMVGVFCLIGLFIPVFMNFSKYSVLTIDKMTTFIRIIMPLYGVMLTLSGRAISAVSFPLSIMMSIGLINELIKNIFMPLIYAYLAVSCISSISSNKGLDRLADMLKGMFVWGLSLSLTFLGMVLTLQKGTLSVADSASLNTVRYAIGFVVPIVGKIISDSADIVLGSAGVILGAFGIFGIIVMIGICALPIIRIGVYALVYKVLSIIGLMVEDNSISKLLGCFCNTFSMLLALSSSVSVLFVIAISLLIAGGGSA